MITKIIWNKEYRLYIYQDDVYESPKNWGNLWTFIMQHKRYDWWDEKFYNHWNSFEEDFAYHINSKYKILLREDEEFSKKELDKIYKWIDKNIIYEEVYMIDHSWVSINTRWFWCPWDSWQIGFIYAHKDKIKTELILEEWEDWEKKLRDILVDEIKTLNQYLEWNVYWFNIESRELIEKDWKTFYSKWDDEDSCWWFYWDDMKELAQEIVWYNNIFTIEEIENCEISYN